MHDLLRTLAQFLVGDESFSGDLQEVQSTRSMKKLRRLTVISNSESVSIPHLDGLRRLCLWIPPSLNTQVIGNLKHLRLLILNGVKTKNIPDNIGDLVHLRLLDLEHTSICKLPDSLGNLVSLQFLLLGDCNLLRILPRSITKLCNLRRLQLRHTRLNYVPKGIGKLKHLNHVTGFIVGDSDGDRGEGCKLQELEMLESLGHLEIVNLEKSCSKSASVLSNKNCLRELVLCCTFNTDVHIQQEEMENIVHVFDELCPPPCLEDLVIANFFGGRYPKWMASTSINSALLELIYLKLINCSNCPHLPQLGQLPELKYLMINGATTVVSIGPEFLGNNGEPTEGAFPKLEKLLFWNMINWEEWSLISGEEDNELESSKLLLFPRLSRIVIDNCPKLKALPRGLNQTSIQELIITGARTLSRISHLPSLRELEVIDCPMLECVEKLESLQSLKLIDYQENNTGLPQWLISFLQQREVKPHDDLFMLHLECSVQALEQCLKGRPHWLFLQQVPRFIGYAEDQCMYLKYTREPHYYETNITGLG